MLLPVIEEFVDTLLLLMFVGDNDVDVESENVLVSSEMYAEENSVIFIFPYGYDWFLMTFVFEYEQGVPKGYLRYRYYSVA